MFLQRHFQNAYVTRSIDRAVETVQQQCGAGDFIFFETDDMIVQTPDGPGPCVVRVGICWIGAFQIELVEPVSGLVRIYEDFLPADDSPRLHHLCMRTDDWGGMRREIDRAGWTVAYEGGVEGMKFVYVDAREILGHYLEYAWATPEMWKAMGWPEGLHAD